MIDFLTMSEAHLYLVALSLTRMMAIPASGEPWVIQLEVVNTPEQKVCVRSLTTYPAEVREETWLRRIVKAAREDPYYVAVTLTCGHAKRISRYQYKKHQRGLLFCFRCRNEAEGRP